MGDQTVLRFTVDDSAVGMREQIFVDVKSLLDKTEGKVAVTLVQEPAPEGTQLDLVTVALVLGITASTVTIISGVIGIIKDVCEMHASKSNRAAISQADRFKAYVRSKDNRYELIPLQATQSEIDAFARKVTMG